MCVYYVLGFGFAFAFGYTHNYVSTAYIDVYT